MSIKKIVKANKNKFRWNFIKKIGDVLSPILQNNHKIKSILGNFTNILNSITLI